MKKNIRAIITTTPIAIIIVIELNISPIGDRLELDRPGVLHVEGIDW
jgi:hypothetical protein